MLAKIYNTYHLTTEVASGDTLEDIKKDVYEGLNVTASNLSENEMEEDWEEIYGDRFKTEEDYLKYVAEGIYDSLVNEFIITEIKTDDQLRDVLKIMFEYEHGNVDDFYANLGYGYEIENELHKHGIHGTSDLESFMNLQK